MTVFPNRTDNSDHSKKLNNSKKNNPCQNESDAIIEFLNKCYEKNSQNQNGKSKDPSEQSQFKNLRKESLK